MQVEELLDECLRIQATGGDVEPLLARYPQQRAEVTALLGVAQAARHLPPARLDPAARARLDARLRTRLHTPPPRPDPNEAFLHSVAVRLGVPRDDIRRAIGPQGAAQMAQFLGLPGYSGLFAALRLLIRGLRALESHGLIL